MPAADQILTVEAMRAAELALVERGESVASLMQIAGRAAAEYVRRIAAGRAITVLCGPGNNGGDGYVIARVLREAGNPVSVIAPLAPTTDAAIEARRAYGEEPEPGASGDILVDCLFGSGLTRPLDEALAALLRRLAAAHGYRIAVDLPSGVESDTGVALNEDLPNYDLTIALGAWKLAHWIGPSLPCIGERRLVDIGIANVGNPARLIARPHISPPAPDAYKYTRGYLAIMGGTYPGAALLAARAAMHAGAGYVKLAGVEPDRAPHDLVVEDIDLTDARLSALLIGPGLGRSDQAKAHLRRCLARDLPTTCDADALMLLQPDMLATRTAPLILTPHAGELEKLCDEFGVPDAPALHRACRLAGATGAVVIAKGPSTLVAAPDGAAGVAPPATSWLSTAGTGDVLAGIVASRLAAGAVPMDAATQGVWLHGTAARLCGPAFTAGTLAEAVPRALAQCL